MFHGSYAWIFFIPVWLVACVAQGLPQGIDFSSLADGELHDIQVVTLDRIVAVGDRGLILGSDNAGRTWSVRHPRSEFIFYSVVFRSELDGCAVGGTIDPFTHRSRGIVLVTTDGGKSWSPSKSVLPRLTGVAKEGVKNLIAWGDWSTTDQTSLYQSADGGVTWTPSIAPCGHIESVAVFKSAPGEDSLTTNRFGGWATGRLVLDRLSRCFFSEDGVQYESIFLPGVSSDEPLRACCHSGTKWWLCGENGQVFSSTDGREWERHRLPGKPSDWGLFSLNRVVARGDDVWICGTPGSVVWHSNDSGVSWQVLPTGCDASSRSIAVFGNSIVAVCGPFATINISRNHGAAWRLSHQSSGRLSTLNIAGTYDRIGWDILAVITKDARQTAGCLVVHDQNPEQRSAYRPEHASRTSVAGKRVGLSTVETFTTFPVSDSKAIPRKTDLVHYPQAGSLLQAPESNLFRKVVQVLRCTKPDLLINECGMSGSPLSKKLSQTVELAATFASRVDYVLYSPESGIPDNSWSVKRTLYRSELSSGRQFHPSTILKGVGMVLGEVIGPVLAIANSAENASLSAHAGYRYRSGSNTPASLLNPLDGIPLDHQTLLKEKSQGATRASLLVSTANWFNVKQTLKHQVVNPLVRDSQWESKLTQSAKMIEPESRAIVLLELAREARRAGDWNLWSSSLEFLISQDNKSAYAEYAQLELMRFTGSAEVNQMLLKQTGVAEQRLGEEQPSISLAFQSSPFGTEADGSVKPASYAHRPQRIPIATDSGIPEFYRLLANLPDAWIPYRLDPEWGWLIASRFRQYQRAKNTNTTLDLHQVQVESANFFPNLSDHLLNWQLISSQEAQLNRKVEFTRNPQSQIIPAIGIASDRPFLDGERTESFWQTALHLVLADPWGEPGTTSLWIARDEEFLYLFSESIDSDSLVTGSASSQRKRDSLRDDQNGIRLRIDLDRDYSTWFEFGWSSSGDMLDACNDMMHWNPDWFVATKQTEPGWNAEIAIPIRELISSDNPFSSLLSHVAVNALHTVPGRGARVIAPAVSDRFQTDQWSLIKW
jgi:photosystem II stability/assembly factor-like uncharacterized protein